MYPYMYLVTCMTLSQVIHKAAVRELETQLDTQTTSTWLVLITSDHIDHSAQAWDEHFFSKEHRARVFDRPLSSSPPPSFRSIV
jgi:hypothetical protein